MRDWETGSGEDGRAYLGGYLRSSMLSVPQRLSGLAQLIEHIAEGCAELGEHVARCAEQGTHAAGGNINSSGDRVCELDRVADELLVERLAASGSCAGVVSEERALPEVLPAAAAPYLVAMDPLDGSSNLGCSIPVGTIFSVRARGEGDPADPESYLTPGTAQVAAGYVIYGAPLELVVTTGSDVHVFFLDARRRWRLRRDHVVVPPQGKIYSVNEANVSRWEPELRQWLESCKEAGYTQRYVGSMVADVHRTLLKGGVFLYPADRSAPEGKLRLLYEAAPMAMLFEAAGGFASDGARRLLEVEAASIHQRTPVVLGGRVEVMGVERALRSSGSWHVVAATRRGRLPCIFEVGGRRVDGHLELSPGGRQHRFSSS
ncbi:MAG: fructose-1,6-bisphosphatase [Myxococcales bacterium]|nr:fructose-1,6-bisphosphatase [Myxococcales bacterium]